MTSTLTKTNEIELYAFLNSIGVFAPWEAESIGGDLFMTKLGPTAAECFNADPKFILMMSCKVKNALYPISIFYLTNDSKKKLGISTLLVTDYSDGEDISGILRKATQDFFARPADHLLECFGKEWNEIELNGVENKSILFDQEPKYFFLEEFFKTHFSGTPKLPVFPSVFHFNNPYLPPLIALAFQEIRPEHSVLAFGCGSALEAALLAKRNNMSIDATDVNPVAVANAKVIAKKLGVENQVRTWVSDIFDTVTKKYDVILFNAPLAVQDPTDQTKKVEDENRFDYDGALLKGLFSELENHLKPNGRLFVMSHKNLDSYLPANLCARPRITFQVRVDLAISEVVPKKEAVPDLFFGGVEPDMVLETTPIN